MAAVLSNGKGFYDALVYVLESLRIGLKFLPPCATTPGPKFTVEGNVIRVPLTRTKGLRDVTVARMIAESGRLKFRSLRDFFERVRPNAEEIKAMIQVGGFDVFGDSRTQQFWEAQRWLRHFQTNTADDQLWLIPPPGLDLASFPNVPLQEPGALEKLRWETELLGFPASGHPLALFPDIAWETYCAMKDLGQYVGQRVVTCGLIIEQRTHHQVTGEPMKFLTLADYTGMVETELFAATYRSYGLTTVRYPVLEIEATVEPYENGNGFSLRVHRASGPRTHALNSAA
jgi:DNA polymerase III alpha subunit